MINWFHYLLITLVAVTGSFQITRAQLPSEQGRGLNRPALIGSVESSEGQLRLNLANQDPTREFRGKARISLGTSEQQAEVARFEFSLAPQESRLFPLDSRGNSGDRFTLEVYDQIGALILLNNAPINRVTDTAPIAAPPTIIAPAPVTPSLNGAKELTVKARLIEERSNQPRRRDIEAPISDETGPAVLSFEIAAPAPIINASLSLRAKEYNDRKKVNVHGSASVEFKLPEDFNQQKLDYALTNSSGLVVASGEVRLEELRKEDSVSVSDIKLDKASYAPGESAHLVMTLEGRSLSGYRMDVTAKDADNATILQDARKGIYHKGASMQEFRIEIPAEAKGTITVEFKVFGNLTRELFDSGVRLIAISEASNKARSEGEAHPSNESAIRGIPPISERPTKSGTEKRISP